MKKLMYVLLLPLLISCASIHSGRYAKVVDADGQVLGQSKKTELGLVVSGEIDTRYCTEYFGLINFTFENQTDRWMRIRDVRIYFESEAANENIKVVSGQDLLHWHYAMEKKLAIQEHNRQMLTISLAALSKAVAAVSRDKNVQALGNLTSAGLLSSLAINEYNKHVHSLETASIFPENHLFANDFVIPPGLFVQKFLLLNSSNHDEVPVVSELFIEYVTEDDQTETIKLQFRNPSIRTKPIWQRKIFVKHPISRSE